MKKSILFIFLSLFLFSAKAQNTQKVSFANDTCLFKTFDLSYAISDSPTPPNTYNPLTIMSLDIPKGKYLHLKLDSKISSNTNHLNGVSALDMVLISKHILGTQVINNPLSLAAADVNDNGIISVSDLVEFRQMILGIKKSFKNNKSWRIYSNNKGSLLKDDKFSILIEKDEILSFYPIKIGDVNGSADSSLGFGSNCF